MSFAVLLTWLPTLALTFGGCCSNALTLEYLTADPAAPPLGTLITFSQFFLIALYGLPAHLTLAGGTLRLKPRSIPLRAYLLQVALFYSLSLLNNRAFAYGVPMAVHIIFRSGGLVISMLLGWAVAGKKYTLTQIFSVILVTFGVLLTTFSASQSDNKQSLTRTSDSPRRYLTGIAILTLALLLSGFLGLAQDYTYSTYRQATPPPRKDATKDNEQPKPTPQWQESMFYLHLLALPMFFLVRHDLASQIRTVLAGPSVLLTFPSGLNPPLSLTIPLTFPPLALNTATQVLCVSGVNRLTTRVSALSVTLVLVVRKAISLVLSVWLGPMISAGAADDVAWGMMWTGAALVLIGSVSYSMGHPVGNSKNIRKETVKGKEE